MRLTTPAGIAILAVAYFAAGKLGLALAFLHPSASPVWPPTGIALAALLLAGYRVWPGIFLGAFFVNLTTTGSGLTSIGIGAGNTLEALTGAYLVSRCAGGTRAFERARDVCAFAVVAGFVSTAVSATVGVTSLALGGVAEWARAGSLWFTWWTGDAVGALIVAPVLILCSQHSRLRWHRGRVLEATLLLLSLVVVGQVVFGGWLPGPMRNYPLSFLAIQPLVWAALRFSPREAALSIVLLSGIAVHGALAGFGPFVRDTPHESLLLLQAFSGVTAVMTMTFAAIVAESRRGEEARSHLATIVESLG
jgi:integral membrane sensor domain MASE1